MNFGRPYVNEILASNLIIQTPLIASFTKRITKKKFSPLPLDMQLSVSHMIKPQPITIFSLKKHNVQLLRIYTEKTHTPYAKIEEGSTIKNLYQTTSRNTLDPKRWVGKVGEPLGLLRSDENSVRTREKKEISLDCAREKIAFDLYQELGRDVYIVPKSRLSFQPIENAYTEWHGLTRYWVAKGVTHSLRVMSEFIIGYQDFSKAQTLDRGVTISFMGYIARYHVPPETILTPTGKSVPLKGFISLLAVARLLSDIDVLGGFGSNAGFIWIQEGPHIVGAQVVKIDPGFAFSFGENQGNWLTATKKGLYPLSPLSADSFLSDLHDLQTATNSKKAIIQWKALSKPAQLEFLATLFNSFRYLKSDQILSFFFQREGQFHHPEMIEEQHSQRLFEKYQEFRNWVLLQQEIYSADLWQFGNLHPLQLIRTHYIDAWGEITLSLTQQTIPVSELYTYLHMVQVGGTSCEIKDLFQGTATRKIVIRGAAGSGKSTLCQKIAHDWATGELWNERFEAVYWLPLKPLYGIPLKESVDDFLVEAISHLILKDAVSKRSLLQQIQSSLKKTLVILDGYDEAPPQLQRLIDKILGDKDLTFIVTCRPENVPVSDFDLQIENQGFSKTQIENYIRQFFTRKSLPADGFLDMLRTHPPLQEMAFIPLQLQMLCSLWEQKKEQFATNKTSLYTQMVAGLLKRSKQTDSLMLLGKHAFEALTHRSHVDIADLHHSFQEYLAAYYLSTNPQEQKDWILQARGQANLSLLFLCGLLSQQNSQLARSFFETLLQPPLENPLPILQLSLQCLNECPEPVIIPSLINLCIQHAASILENPLLYRQTALLKALYDQQPLLFHQETFLWICSFGNLEFAQYLVSQDPSFLKTCNKKGWTSLHAAVEGGHQQIAQWLLEQSTELLEMTTQNGSTPLLIAVMRGHRPLVQLLLQKGARLEATNNQEETVIHLAALQGELLILQDLLTYPEAKKLINVPDDDGKTPLHKAVWGDPKPAIVQLLLEHGADPQVKNAYGYTPLHWAAKHGHIESAKLLIQQGASWLVANTNHDLPFDLAIRWGQEEFVHAFFGTKKSRRLPPAHTTQEQDTYYSERFLEAKKRGWMEEQIVQLAKLSDLSLERFKSEGNEENLLTTSCINSFKILNAAVAILKEYKIRFPLDTSLQLFENHLLMRLEKMELIFLESQKIIRFESKKDHLGVVKYCREQMKKIRAQLQTAEPIFLESQKIKTMSLEDQLGVLQYYREQMEKTRTQPQTVEHIKDLTQQFKRILRLLIQHAQGFLGPPPVQWACIAMGSMARDEMCPYSDIECTFLVKKETPEGQKYLALLSQLLDIKIINLGETAFPLVEESSPTPSGFCRDAVLNSVELIGTPLDLAQQLTANWIQKDMVLSNAMSSVCWVAGDHELVCAYQKHIQEALDKGKTFFSNEKSPRYRLALNLLVNHIDAFAPNLSKHKEQIKAFGIKKELYRPFQEIISSLALFYELKSFNTMERMDELIKLKVFSPQGATNLKKALSQALTLRLEAHLFYKGETEYLYQIEEGKPEDKNKLYLTPQKVNILQEIYKVLIPFCKATQKFYNSRDKKEFYTQTFYDDNLTVQAQALTKSLQYTAAKEACQHAVSLNPNNVDALLWLAYMERELGDEKEHLQRAQQALQLAKQRYGEQHSDVADSLSYIGSALNALGKPAEGLGYHKQALKILKTLYNEHHPEVASSLNNIGSALEALGKPAEGLEYFKQALEIWQTLYGYHHPDVATCLSNIGSALQGLGKTEEALGYYKQALEIDKNFHGEQHPNVAISLNNIGGALEALGKPVEGREYFKQAMEIRKNLYGEQHPCIADSLTNLGSTLFDMGNFPEALAALQKALNIYLQSYGPDHPSVKNVQSGIAITQEKMEQ